MKHGKVKTEERYVEIFFFNDTATTGIYTLSLHDALQILVTGDVQNVLGRIGGSVSTIDGAIAITGSDEIGREHV